MYSVLNKSKKHVMASESVLIYSTKSGSRQENSCNRSFTFGSSLTRKDTTV